jgi:peptide/nickel transport system permease protein
VVQGVTLMVAAVVLLVNLLVDVLYAYVDPQIRYQRM